MARDPERSAFARAASYLSYKAVARWTAYAAAVGSALMLIVLLVLLALFADVVVHRGQLPEFRDLTAGEQEKLLEKWGEVSPQEKERKWREEIHEKLRTEVSPEADEWVLERGEDKPEFGILSLATRSALQGRFYAPLVTRLARWSDWMWDS